MIIIKADDTSHREQYNAAPIEYIYILKPKNNNVYKIGQTTNLKNRIKKISSKYAFEVEYLFTVPVKFSFNCEQILHIQFRKHHLGGDWFAFEWDALLNALLAMDKLRFRGEI